MCRVERRHQRDPEEQPAAASRSRCSSRSGSSGGPRRRGRRPQPPRPRLGGASLPAEKAVELQARRQGPADHRRRSNAFRRVRTAFGVVLILWACRSRPPPRCCSACPHYSTGRGPPVVAQRQRDATGHPRQSQEGRRR
eukprot:2219281-Pyramimonas_sp.AAC.1